MIERVDDFDLTAKGIVDISCRRQDYRIDRIRGADLGCGHDLPEGVVGRGRRVAAPIGDGHAVVEGVVGVVVGDGSCRNRLDKLAVILNLKLRLNRGRDGRGRDRNACIAVDRLRRGGDVATDVLGFGDRGEGAEVGELAAGLGGDDGAVTVGIERHSSLTPEFSPTALPHSTSLLLP